MRAWSSKPSGGDRLIADDLGLIVHQYLPGPSVLKIKERSGTLNEPACLYCIYIPTHHHASHVSLSYIQGVQVVALPVCLKAPPPTHVSRGKF
ncbi:hypothetical protein Pcinc_013334 [Petrolisthes cinctipes]|uniref:Uncharacterized protein n=1 Tax=Petrolisthes cinctipes TaxID=88211 RepID=A0AAE1FX83_PETCI|nr:hypothetical protein Pcinc_013334 [Petrolisthes cinctipes]